ncbi:MAG: hypothetical protein KIS73_26985 [Enhydrobacter sp.]|nr:hypothetical protein [Enhydrobacter sp.]
MFGLSRFHVILIGVGLAAVLIIGGIRALMNASERASASEVKAKVSAETVRTLDDARISKERTDEEVRRTPYDDRADGLR